MKKNISLSTANRMLNKYIGKPKVIRKVFYMKPIDKILRVQFCKFMKENNIGPENIFFAVESVFPLYAYLNKGTNKIRLSKKTRRNLKSVDEKSINLDMFDNIFADLLRYRIPNHFYGCF